MLALEEAIYSKLAAGTALTELLGGTAIYNALGPQGTAVTYPLVIFTKSSGSDDNDSPRRCRTLTYQVTGISDRSKKEAEQIDNAIDNLLFDSALTITGWNEYFVRRYSDISYVEQIPGGKVLWHEGGLYRVRIQD